MTHTITEITQVPVRLADGRVRMGRQTQQRQMPDPPRDWDHIILTGVTIAALAFLAVSIVWTAASVGALLAHAAPAWIAYTASGGFDLMWVMCLGLEWLSRHDRDRAEVPRRSGIVFLAVSMAAVGIHGWQSGNAAVGIVGAAVAALAKGMWAVVMRYRHIDLPEPVRDVLTQERAELGLELALAAHQRTALRTRAHLAAYRAHLGVTEHHDTEDHQENRGADGRAAGTIRAAVRAAHTTLPDADAADIVAQLAHAGIAVDEDTVRDVIGPWPDGDAERVSDLAGVAAIRPDARPDASGYPDGSAPAQATAPDAATGIRADSAPRASQGPSSIAAGVRELYHIGITDPDAVCARLRPWFSDVKPETVARQLRDVRRSSAGGGYA
jgi:hypothetical protein